MVVFKKNAESINQKVDIDNVAEETYSAISSRRYWIFQGDPDRYDVKKYLYPEKKENWIVSRFKDDIDHGDIVFFWRSGDAPGIYGWGEITGHRPRTENTSESEGVYKIEVTYRERFNTHLSRKRLVSLPDDFRGLTILRYAVGTNFRMTTLESESLIRLISDDKIGSPPHGPDKFDDNIYVGRVLNDYRYHPSPIRILNAAVDYLGGGKKLSRLSPESLLDVMLDYPLDTGSDKPYATDFLQEHFSRNLTPDRGRSINWNSISQSNLSSNAERISLEKQTLYVIDAARMAAIMTRKKERIYLRDLIAGMLIGGFGERRNSNDEMFLRLERKGTVLRKEYLDYLEKNHKERWPEENIKAWHDILLRDAEDPQNMLSLEHILTKVNADATEGVDKLNITPDVEALASVMAARDVEPPFAIGLFGDWGSGKTFFMRKVFERTEKISNQSAEAVKDKPNAYCSKVIQIWFNAWHYVESNLWASLVDRIFSELKRYVKGDKEGKEEFEQLINQLGISQARRDAINERLKNAESRKKNLEKAKEKLTNERDSAQKTTNKELGRKILDEIKDHVVRKKLIAMSGEVEGLLGIKGLKEAADKTNTSARSLLDFISETGLIAGRTQNLWRALINAKIPINYWIWFAVALLSVVVLGNLVKWGDVTTFILEVSAVIGASTTWARKHLKKASNIMDGIEGFQNRLKNKVDEAEKARQEKISAFESELDRLNQSILATETDLQKAEQEVEEIQSELNATPSERLVQFIAERAESQDYRKHLGLLALIRQDFEKLYDLMKRQQDPKQYKEELPNIERIILYIDDLDRCPPERVTEVLQAIHLLLAFPLFMVIVGVDARWVSRSLKEHYPFLIHDKANNHNSEDKDKEIVDPYAATTEDYLEKIFQMPFWLKSIDQDSAGNLIKGIIAPTDEDKVGETEGQDKQDRKQSEDELNKSAGGAGNFAEDEEEGYQEEKIEVDEKIDLNPRTLKLTDKEVNFMTALGGLIGRSPRAVKRFINVYRILKASNNNAHTNKFIEEEEFQSPIFLLAVLTGHPKSAEHFFGLLDKAQKSQLFKGFINKLPKEIPGISRYENLEWSKLRSSIIALEKQMADKKLIQLTPTIDSLCMWLPSVARFSYKEWRQ